MSTTVEVSPKEIKRPVKPGKYFKETLTVRNVGSDRHSYRVRPAEAYRSWIDPDANHFAINAFEARDVTLEVEPPRGAKVGLHEFKIIVANDDDEEDRAEVDVTFKVPFSTIWWIIIAVVVIVIIVLVLLWTLQPLG